MKNKILNLVRDKNLYVITLIVLVFFGMFVKMDFATDTYNVFMNLNMTIITHFASCGRFITAGLLFIVYKLKIGNEVTYIASYIISILAMTLSVYKLSNLIKKEVKTTIVPIVLSLICILNIFSIELFMYLEKGVIVASILFCVMAVEKIVKYFEEKNKKELLLAILFMLIAVTCYQGTVALFIAISLIYVCKHSKKIKEFIINNIIVAFCYGIPAIINLVTARVFFVNQRVGGEIILKDSIIKVIAGTKNMLIQTYLLFPKYMYLASFILVAILIVILAVKKEKNIKLVAKHIFNIIYIVCGILLATIFPQLLQNTESIWFVARSTYAGASILGILLIYLFYNFDLKEGIKKAIIICSIIFMVIQLRYFYKVEIDHYILNYNDKIIAKQIGSIIDEYEKNSGIKVNKICTYEDATISYTYPNVLGTGDINITAFFPSWSRVELIEFYTDRRFERVEKNEKIEEDFSKKDWKYFEQEQIIFDEDTVHICVF